MLLHKIEAPFDDDRFIFEPKIDGHRMIISRENDKVTLFTRHSNDVTQKYPELHDVPVGCDADVVLDGEVACVDQSGWVDFEMIQKRFMLQKPHKIHEAIIRQPVVFFVFDILMYDGKDLRALPLIERKQILSEVLTPNQHFSPVVSVDGAGMSMFEVIRQKNLEGIVAKRRDSKYVGRRNPNWLKIINYSYAECQIAGYRKQQFGWLLHHNNRPVGVLELAVPPAHKKAFYQVSKSIITGEDRNFVYVKPSIKARVRFRNWYRSGLIRSPEFVDFVV